LLLTWPHACLSTNAQYVAASVCSFLNPVLLPWQRVLLHTYAEQQGTATPEEHSPAPVQQSTQELVVSQCRLNDGKFEVHEMGPRNHTRRRFARVAYLQLSNIRDYMGKTTLLLLIFSLLV
jgi:hypothetical protein